LDATILPNNRIAGLGYDAAGDLTSDPSVNGIYTYDAEGRMLTASSTLGSGSYSYDGDGKRVKKSSGTLYWTGLGADALVETDTNGNLVADPIGLVVGLLYEPKKFLGFTNANDIICLALMFLATRADTVSFIAAISSRSCLFSSRS